MNKSTPHSRSITGCTIILWLSLVTGAVAAPQVDFTIQPEVISLGEAATCKLTIRGMENAPAPQFPPIKGLQINGPAVQRNISMVNGRMDRSFTYSYSVVGTSPGTHSIGPFSYQAQGETIHLPELKLQVVGPDGSREDESISDWLFARLQPSETKLYSQQNFSLTLSVYVSPRLSIARDISLLDMPEAGLSNHRFHEIQSTREVIDGQIYDVRKFRTEIRALTEGTFELQPTLRLYMLVQKKAQRQRGMFNDPFFNSFFERTEKQPVDIPVEGTTLQVQSLPDNGRPDSFTGAVGQFDLQVRVSPLELMAGEPITVTAEIKGHGNMDAVGMPATYWGDRIKTYEPRLSTRELNDAGSQGRKVIEQVVIPRSSDIIELPEIRFSYFNPALASYETITRGPFPVTVHPAAEGHAQMLNMGTGAPQNTRILGSDIVYLKPRPDRWITGRADRTELTLHSFRWYLVPFLVAACAFAAAMRRQRLSTDVSYARRQKAPRAARAGLRAARAALQRKDASGVYEGIWQSLTEYLGHRFNLPAGQVDIDTLQDCLNQELLDDVQPIFKACEVQRYASDTARDDMDNCEELLTATERFLKQCERLN